MSSSTVSSLLNVGATGLRAQSVAVNVTSQNLTNVQTEGYTRRNVLMDPLQGPPDGGGGVIARGSLRIVDQYVERRWLGAISEKAGAEASLQLSSRIDEVLSDSSGNVGQALDAFRAAVRDVSVNPSDTGARQVMLSRADRVASTFRDAETRIEESRDEADRRMTDAIAQANAIATEISQLSQQISRSEASGNEASDLRDRRDQRIRELGKIVPITAVTAEQGRITVLLAGREPIIAADGTIAPLKAVPDATTGRIRVERTAAGAPMDVTSWLNGAGSLGGLVEARDGALASAQTSLDQLAFDFANAYNTVQTAGFGLDGVSGRKLFDVSATATGAAASIALSVDVAGFPDRIGAASTAATVPGDNRNALDLAALETATVMSGGETVDGALGSLITSGGLSVQAARDEVDARSAVEAQAKSARDSISGVNSDDEMVALTQYQRAYEAATKVVQTADEMLQTLLQLKR
jgi:flagellar hook-associated protein 1 FlgK